MSKQNFPAEVIEAIRDSVDCNLYFFETKVENSTMYLILIGTIILLIALYVIINMIKKKTK